MDRTEEILREQLKVDKAVGLGKLMWEIHKNTLKKRMQIYADEQLRIGGVVKRGGTLAISWGKYGGFYWCWKYTKRLCLGWIALTYIPNDLDNLLK